MFDFCWVFFLVQLADFCLLTGDNPDTRNISGSLGLSSHIAYILPGASQQQLASVEDHLWILWFSTSRTSLSSSMVNINKVTLLVAVWLLVFYFEGCGSCMLIPYLIWPDPIWFVESDVAFTRNRLPTFPARWSQPGLSAYGKLLRRTQWNLSLIIMAAKCSGNRTPWHFQWSMGVTYHDTILFICLFKWYSLRFTLRLNYFCVFHIFLNVWFQPTVLLFFHN